MFFVLGAAAWSLTEYCLHRFAGHGPRRKRDGRLISWLTPGGLAAAFHEEHVAHHANPDYFAPGWKKLSVALVALPAVGGVMSLVIGPRRGMSFAAGFAGAYLAYEYIHRRVHTHPPKTAYMHWVDKNHLYHHVNPKVRHGVTSPVWDAVFGTDEPIEGRVKLHVRMAPGWMTNPATGEVHPEHADDYQVHGKLSATA